MSLQVVFDSLLNDPQDGIPKVIARLLFGTWMEKSAPFETCRMQIIALLLEFTVRRFRFVERPTECQERNDPAW